MKFTCECGFTGRQKDGVKKNDRTSHEKSKHGGKRMHWTPFGVGTSQRLTDHFTLINRPNLVARPMVITVGMSSSSKVLDPISPALSAGVPTPSPSGDGAAHPAVLQPTASSPQSPTAGPSGIQSMDSQLLQSVPVTTSQLANSTVNDIPANSAPIKLTNRSQIHQKSGKRKMVRPPRSVDDLVVAVISLAEGIAEGQSSSAQRIELQALSHKLQSQIKDERSAMDGILREAIQLNSGPARTQVGSQSTRSGVKPPPIDLQPRSLGIQPSGSQPPLAADQQPSPAAPQPLQAADQQSSPAVAQPPLAADQQPSPAVAQPPQAAVQQPSPAVAQQIPAAVGAQIPQANQSRDRQLFLLQTAPALVTPARAAPLPPLLTLTHVQSCLINATSLQQICNIQPPAYFRVEGSKVVCRICKDKQPVGYHKGWGVQVYHDLPPNQTNKSRKWIRMNKSLRDHMEDSSHTTFVEEARSVNPVVTNMKATIRFRIVNVGITGIMLNHSHRSFPQVIAARIQEGVMMGNQDHSSETVPYIVDTAFLILREKVLEAAKSTLIGFPLPFFITCDKDQSKMRKRMVLAVRMLSLDDNLTLPLIMSLYIGSPASVDNTGQGMATTILTTLEEFGFDRAIVKSSMSGGCYDGQLLVCKVVEAIFQQLDPPPAVVNNTKVTKMQVWDPSHLLELVLKKCLKRFPDIQAVKKHVHDLSVFFRDSEVYEYLLPAAQALCKRLYSPKALKDLKFVAHGADLLEDYIRNFSIYEAALNEIAANHTNQDTQAKALGHLNNMLRSDILMSVHFLRGLTWILKRCSLSFQNDQGLVNTFVNTQELLVLVIDQLSVLQDGTHTVSPACQYVFRDYLDMISRRAYVPPGRGTRQRPTSSLASQQELNREMLELNRSHQDMIVDMRAVIRYYWYANNKWWRESATRLPAAGHFLNKLEAELNIDYIDVLIPENKRCSLCHAYVPDNTRQLNRHAQGQCLGAQFTDIPSLGAAFTTVKLVELGPLQRLSRDPTQVNDASFSMLVLQLKKAKDEVDRDRTLRGVTCSLQHYCKKLLITQQLRSMVNPGMLHLLTVLLTAAVSEALCETLGSEMEMYHKNRYTNAGPHNDDLRLQKEMFVKRNGPPIGNNRQFVQKVADTMNQVGVPYMDGRLDPRGNVALRKFKFGTRAYYEGAARDPVSIASVTSVTVNNLVKNFKGKTRKGALERFY